MNRGWKNKNRLQENYFDFFLLQRSSAHLLAKTVPPARFFLLRSPLRVRIPYIKNSKHPLGYLLFCLCTRTLIELHERL